MKFKILILSVAGLASVAPAFATECAQHIQAIERRMNSAGAQRKIT